MTGDPPEPLDLRSEDALDLGNATDFHILLRAIDESMPETATLVLEGNATAPAVAAFLREREAKDAREVARNSEPTSAVFHLPLAHGNLRALRLLAEDHLRSEVADHLVVYQGDEVLLWAQNAGDGIVTLARSLPDETLRRFREALGATLRNPRRRGWFGLRRSRDH